MWARAHTGACLRRTRAPLLTDPLLVHGRQLHCNWDLGMPAGWIPCQQPAQHGNGLHHLWRGHHHRCRRNQARAVARGFSHAANWLDRSVAWVTRWPHSLRDAPLFLARSLCVLVHVQRVCVYGSVCTDVHVVCNGHLVMHRRVATPWSCAHDSNTTLFSDSRLDDSNTTLSPRVVATGRWDITKTLRKMYVLTA